VAHTKNSRTKHTTRLQRSGQLTHSVKIKTQNEKINSWCCRRHFDKVKKRLRKVKPGHPNYYTVRSEARAYKRVTDRLISNDLLVPTTNAPNMCKALVRELMVEELRHETVRYSEVVRARRKVIGRPESSKFFRGVEKRHKTATEIQQANQKRNKHFLCSA
jgi:hypothetical protein